ncbi:MAG: tRNA lysidine(34) synthetase TilS [Candidatus Latescibacteria bacterium]|nr:tRNA lysidine(34) synthetase TilS [Candidatus Latescibacterota bacterium]
MTPSELRARVGNFLRDQAGVRAGDRLLVALSGGLDSAVLLDLLAGLRHELGLGLHAAHFDHRLRPGSAADSRFAAGLAAARDVAISEGSGEVAGHARQHHLSLEAAARQLRYAFLDEVAQATGCSYIALGHHANDQAETLLLHLLRGSGAAGLGAMRPVRQGRYLRPLLEIERPVLAAYAQARGITFCEDPSNADLRFTRNRVRRELVPQLQARYNPALVQTLSRTARILQAEDELLAEMAQQALQTVVCEQSPHKIVLAAPSLVNYHIAVQRRIVRMLFEAQGQGPFDFDPLEAVLALARRSGSGLLPLRAGWRMQRAGEHLILRRGQLAPAEEKVQSPGQTPVPSRGCTLITEELPAARFPGLRPRLGAWCAALDAEALAAPLTLRSPRPGDRFQPLGLQGRKKLSDLLIDRKWPRILRDELLLLTSGDQIAWVAGLEIGHPFRVRPDSRRLLLLELQRES